MASLKRLTARSHRIESARTPILITPYPAGRLFGVALSQALRARLRSYRPSGTFRNRLSRSRSVAPGLTSRFREEWLDDLFQVDALTFRARQLLRVVFLDGQDLVKFMMAAATDVFVKRHDAQ
jgi:hypothetical protein